jgi:hypothetical protein
MFDDILGRVALIFRRSSLSQRPQQIAERRLSVTECSTCLRAAREEPFALKRTDRDARLSSVW